jgi:hypothetical protein
MIVVPGAASDGPTYWDWSERKGFAALAGYVSTDSLRGHDLLPHGGRVKAAEGASDQAESDEAAIDREVAARLFGRLAAREIRYREEPWRTGTDVQGIRHADWLLSEGGNCLDFCVTYAAMCLEMRVAPLLALTATHALVLIRPGWLSEGRQAAVPFELAGTALLEAGALEVGDHHALLAAARNGELLAVDPAVASRERASFERATAEADDALRAVSRIVDVTYLLASGEIVPLAPPTGWPAVRRYPASGFGRIELLAAQTKVAMELAGASGLHAIVADPGQGKSTVARHVCGEALGRSAWFLNAADPKALEDSLAEAELAERGESLADLGRPDREAFAYAALDRLRRATTPWVVVLDNANGTRGSLGRLVPRPQRPGQLVLVTSTNPSWTKNAEVTHHPLGEATESEVEKALGGRGLTEITGGSPLLMGAFSRLLAAATRDGEELAAGDLAAKLYGIGEGLDGASAYWRALSGAASFGEAEMRVAARAALLPPDRLSADLVDSVAAAPPGTFAELAGRGLLDLREGEESALHRVFGAAIRDRPLPPRFEPPADEEVGFWEAAALDLLTDPAAKALLGRFGDRETVGRLLALIEGLDERSPASPGALGRALHGVAVLLEERGSTELSGAAYERLERHLDDADPDDRRLRAECLHSRARGVYRDLRATETQLREGLAWAEQAHETAAAVDGPERAGKFLAMQGLIQRRLAAYPRRGETEVGLLRGALAVLDEAHELRGELLDKKHPEFARSLFNLAGIRILLAKAERDAAAEHLAAAAGVYEDVIRIRSEIYSVPVHPHLATCVQGLGTVRFYEVVLGDPGPEERTALLRKATEETIEALRQWGEIEGATDATEVSKGSKLLAKIAIARHAYPQIQNGKGTMWSHVASLQVELAEDFGAG